MRQIARGAVMAAVLALLAGCTGSDDSSAGGSPAASPPAAGAPAASAPDTGAPASGEPPAGEVQTLPELEEGWEGILADVTVGSCPTEAGQVTAEGTVVNSADETRDIAIAISWNAPDSTDSLMQLAVTEEDVPPGETVTWSVSGDLPADAGQCVVLARSGALTGS